jgi:CRISPR-associated endonuclease/helicase Cas3
MKYTSDESGAVLFFRETFSAIMGREPYLWQRRFFLRCTSGSLPRALSLPTSCGKTTVIHCWVLALAWRALLKLPVLHRRLVLMVNLRAVVDQATLEVEKLLTAFQSAPPESTLHEAWSAISLLSWSGRNGKSPLAVGTLRGQHADDHEWSRDPSRPAVILATPDMAGSRLLGQGYGDGKWSKPQHAGLLGCDSVLVLDEPYLVPVFSALLEAVQKYQSSAQVKTKLLHVMTMSAVAADIPPGVDDIFELLPEDFTDPALCTRLSAEKHLHIVPSVDKTDLTSSITRHALQEGMLGRVLIYVKYPKQAVEIAKLVKPGGRHADKSTRSSVLLLTGRMRGLERDKLAASPQFQRFLSHQDPHSDWGPVYLVATSAGEAGADLNADRGVCDWVSADSMLQRFGRYHRTGTNLTPADVWVVCTKDAAEEYAATLTWLQALPGGDISPKQIYSQPPPSEALQPRPLVAPLHPHHLDAWFMTSLSYGMWPQRAEVAPWIHGQEINSSETTLVWRDDVQILQEEHVDPSYWQEILEAYPIAAVERLVLSTHEVCWAKPPTVLTWLKESGQSFLWCGSDGTVEAVTASTLNDRPMIGATLVLPTDVGGFDASLGCFDPHSCTLVPDAADQTVGRKRLRVIARQEADHWHLTALGGSALLPETTLPFVLATTVEEVQAWLRAKLQAQHLRVRLAVPLDSKGDEEADPPTWIFYCSDRKFAAVQSASTTVPLDQHNQRVGAVVEELADLLQVSSGMAADLASAGRVHDNGKAVPSWQYAAGQSAGAPPVAKSSYFMPTYLSHLRHELCSALPLAGAQQYLVAAHHGWARPGFRLNAGGSEVAEEDRVVALNEQVMLQLNLLQQKFGWWGLAWLESILRASDALVSAEEEE